MEDRKRNEDEGALPPGEPTQTDPANDPAEPPELPELAQGDDTASRQIELEGPSGAVEASPGQDAAAEAHRRFSEFAKDYLAEIERRTTGTSADTENISWPEAMLPDNTADPAEEQRPKRETYDLLYRHDKVTNARIEQLPYFRPEHGGPPPNAQLLSDVDGENRSPTDSVEPPASTAPDAVIEAPSNPAHAPDVPSPAYAAPPARRSVRLPFPGESRDDAPDTFEGLVELHERQTAFSESTPSASSPTPSSPSEPSPPATPDQSRPEDASPTIADDSSLHTLPQVLVTVSLIDAERMVSEEFRSMADEHAEAMRQIASEALDEYNFKLMAELRAAFGR